MSDAKDAASWSREGEYAVKLRGWTIAKYGPAGSRQFVLWEGLLPVGVFGTAQEARDRAAEIEAQRAPVAEAA